jgi:hypothetical protein
MLNFLKDLIIFPFDNDKENNKFSNFLQLILKDYPAFLRNKVEFKRIVLLPFLALYNVFSKKIKNP